MTAVLGPACSLQQSAGCSSLADRQSPGSSVMESHLCSLQPLTGTTASRFLSRFRSSNSAFVERIHPAPQICRHGRRVAGIKGFLSSESKGAFNHERPKRSVATAAASSSNSSGFVTKKLAVFVSGGGSNFKSIHKSILEGKIYGEVAAVVSDKPGCGGWQYAAEADIPTLAFPKGKFAPEGASVSELIQFLREKGVECIILAGYLKLIPSELVEAYPRSILNIHPALLPAFGGKGYYGMKVHEAVIKSGARFSGPTVHFIDEKYDHGPTVAQAIVPVLPFDTPSDLQARVLAQEHVLYSKVVAALCEDRITWRDDGVPLIRTSWDGGDYE